MRRMVWVDVPGGFRYPGIVMCWRRSTDHTWAAQVAMSRQQNLVIAWITETDLTPIIDERPVPGR